MVVEGLAVLPRALDDIADRHLAQGHLVAQLHEGVGDEQHGGKRVHGFLLQFSSVAPIIGSFEEIWDR